MVKYSDDILKKVQKHLLPQEIFVHFNNVDEEKSAIIKRSLLEMYEDILDKKVIDQFEKEEHTFVTADDIMKEFI